jgi:protein-L-isoaspartate(D-aspartate) O-methyltransferase
MDGTSVNKPSFEMMRAAMVDSQLRTVGVNDARVVDAIAAVPRERFAARGREMLAYVDEDHAIAPGRYMTQPMMFGRLLNAARIQPNERVLLVAAGNGYGAAVIARLAAEVVAVEEHPELAARARETLASMGVANVAVVDGPLTGGASDGAPYDVVFIDGAVEQVTQALIDQLRDGGRLVAVMVDAAGVQRATIGVRAGSGFGTTEFSEAATVRLPGFERPKAFRF